MTGPVLTTERFELWQPAPGDLTDLFELTRDEGTRRFLGGFVPSEMDAFNRLHRNAGGWAFYRYGIFMVRPKGDTRIVATCGVFRSHRGFGAEFSLDDVAEAGWIVHKDWAGQGVASEVMTAALAWFDRVHGRQRIACMIEDGNHASFAIARKLGFEEYARHTPEGEARAMVLLERV